MFTICMTCTWYFILKQTTEIHDYGFIPLSMNVFRTYVSYFTFLQPLPVKMSQD